MNIVTLIGNVGADPEVRYTQGGDPIANVRLATSETWKTKEGEKREQTEWHRVSFFGGVAKVVKDYVTKGSRIAVVGKIHYSEYTDKDGNKRYGTEIRVARDGKLELLGGPKGAKPEAGPDEPFQATDDDVPF